MSKAVVDSRVVIAYLRPEMGWEALEAYLVDTCAISAVNLTEVVGTLRDQDIAAGALDTILDPLAQTVMPYDEAQARKASELRVSTKALGLSLGDRACQALAAAQQLAAVTTDAIWGQVDVGVTVRVVR